MNTKKAVEDEATGESDLADTDIDRAVGDLRGVLEKGAKPTVGSAGEMDQSIAFGSGDGFEDMSAAEKAFPNLDEFDSSTAGSAGNAPGSGESRLDMIMQIPIEVKVVLGGSTMPVSSLMKLTEGSTIGLDRKIGEPVEIMVNGRVIGRGEITVLEGDDTRFGVRLTEVETGKS